MSREKSLAKNTLIIALGTYLPRLASIVTLPILTGLLTQDEYGTYDLVTVMVSLLLPALTLQIHAAAFRFLVDSREDVTRVKAIVSNVFALVLPVSVISLTVMYVVLSGMANACARLLICLYFFAEIVSVDLRQVARGVGKALDYSLSAIAASAGTLLGAIVFVWHARLGLTGAVASLGLANVLSAAYLFVRLRTWELVSPRYVDTSLMLEMLQYSWPIVPNELSLWVMNLSDRLIVTAALGIAANAVYAVANKIPHLISMAQGAFTLAWQENASMASSDEDASTYYSEMFRMIFDLQAGFFGLVISASPVLFTLLIHGDYGDAYPLIPTLCLGTFFSCMATFLGGIYVARMATKSIGITTVTAAFVNIVLNALFIRVLGLHAAALSTLVSFAALFAFRVYDVRRLVAIKYDLPHMVKVFAILLLESVFCYLHRLPLDVANMVLSLIAGWVLNQNLLRKVFAMVGSKVWH